MADLLTLKRRWLPLFFAGAAFFGAGLALFLLWIYRSSPLVDVVVGLATTPARGIPPRGTLVSLAAALFTLIGGLALIVAVRRINASEIGEIDSFWHKVAVAALAGRWWLAEPRVVVVTAGEAALPVLRGLKAFTSRTTVLVPPEAERKWLVEVLVALAEDEDAVRRLSDVLSETSLGFDVRELSADLRLRGRVEHLAESPRVADAIARAEAIVFGPDHIGVTLPAGVAQALRHARGKRIVIPPTLDGGDLNAQLETLTGLVGKFDAALVNSNTVPPLAEGRRYLAALEPDRGIRAVVARDLVDWADPARHDASKLAVFLREVILRG